MVRAEAYPSTFSDSTYSRPLSSWTLEGSTMSTFAKRGRRRCLVTLPMPAPQSNTRLCPILSLNTSMKAADVSISVWCTFPYPPSTPFMDASCAYTHHAREAPYIPVVDLLLVPSLLSLGGGDFGILQLALPHLVNG